MFFVLEGCPKIGGKEIPDYRNTFFGEKAISMEHNATKYPSTIEFE
jgi:hypothetical protein